MKVLHQQWYCNLIKLEQNTLYTVFKIFLSKYRPPLNGEPVFIRESLPYPNVEVKIAADNVNLITANHNCPVKWWWNNEIGKSSNKTFRWSNSKWQKTKPLSFRGSKDFKKQNFMGVLNQVHPNARYATPLSTPHVPKPGTKLASNWKIKK